MLHIHCFIKRNFAYSNKSHSFFMFSKFKIKRKFHPHCVVPQFLYKTHQVCIILATPFQYFIAILMFWRVSYKHPHILAIHNHSTIIIINSYLHHCWLGPVCSGTCPRTAVYCNILQCSLSTVDCVPKCWHLWNWNHQSLVLFFASVMSLLITRWGQ